MKAITPDRFYHTGDVGVLDADGNLRIVGRIKELIIRGGANIYPAEVEQVLFPELAIVFFVTGLIKSWHNACRYPRPPSFVLVVLKVLHQHPSIQVAQVVGVPDARLGEEVAACLQIKKGHSAPSTDDIRAFCSV